jgi:hypothetical protein
MKKKKDPVQNDPVIINAITKRVFHNINSSMLLDNGVASSELYLIITQKFRLDRTKSDRKLFILMRDIVRLFVLISEHRKSFD